MSLTNKAVSGVLWTSSHQVGQIILQFVVGIVLARLLDPADYGLFALVGVFLVFFNIPVEGGLALAVVQRKDLSDEDVSTVFWFNLGASLTAYAAVWFGAPLLAAFYSEPELVSMTRVVGATVIIGALAICQKARLERKMEFRKLALVQLPAFAVSAAVAIWMAHSGFGAWSLVGMALTSTGLTCLTIWGVSSWRPGLCFSTRSFRALFGFGVNTALESLSNAVFQNLLTLVIGRIYSPIEVGFYNRARHYQQLPAGSIYSVLAKVMLPLLSSVQDQPHRLRRAFSQALRLSTILSFPALLGLAALAEPLVWLMIGEKWLPCVPYLQILCLSATILPVQAINVNAILSQGRSDISLKINLIKKLNLAIVIALTYPYGIEAMLWGQVATSILAFFINAWPNRKLMHFGIRKQLQIMAPYAIISLIMAVAVMVVVYGLKASPWVEVLVGVLLGVLIYLIGIRIVRVPEHRELASLAARLPVAGRVLQFVLT
ncbi:lipopolysaccharide biosynthesis protein [Haloferula sp. A504]|uniref:lipopolysaccharide biosynthesis protein n=1 Tax=Haloferula sp. A504 TaxID=3373601 RepID=UPI0031C5589A|nr:lipopolysaccharide biosynthesis protein [Verrucomicrobiaceae bacterium E54]